MVQGTMSGAGKSLLCAALCRIFAQDGLRAVPFKSQNMALNSFVTKDGLEMGRAQVVQAQAAGVEPDVRMNPILLKPSSDVGSQVIVNGEVRGQMKASEYFRTKRQLVPDILKAYDSLAEEADVIVIEGAGSPAEINLKSEDIVNMGLAEMVDAPVLLVGDIDRGGVFAQLYGTVELLEEKERRRIKGLVINKFRGDVEILRPGLSMLEEKTHLPVVGVVPYLKVDIEDEDSLSQRLEMRDGKKPLDAAIIRLPHLSNFTDFMPLEQHPLLGVRYVSNAHELGAPDLILLPGTKTRWMTCSGCGSAGWKRLCSSWPRRARRCWASAAATRCWARPSTTPPAARAAGRRLCVGWVCCPPGPCSASRSAAHRSKRPSPPPLCGCRAGRLRDPHRRDRGGGRTLRPLLRRRPGGLCAGQCVRHLPPWPVRHRYADRGAGGLALPPEGHRPLRRGPHPDGRVPPPAVRHPGRRRARGAGYGRGVCRDGNGEALNGTGTFASVLGRRKGKTTAAMGLALRALGSGKRVVIVQFLKGGNSGEIPLLAQLGAEIYRGKAGQKFVFQMTPEEKAATRELQNQNLAAAMAQPADLLVLDEAGSAEELDMVDVDLLKRPFWSGLLGCECVLTAHTPPQWMLDAADYSTEMKCHRHPYQKGIKARKGIEY